MRNFFKVLPLVLLFFFLPLIIVSNRHKLFFPIKEVKGREIETIDKIIKENKDKELITNKYYEKFVYLSFLKDNNYTNYMIDINSGEEKDFFYYVKVDKREEFLKKVSELLYLKYPVFIAKVLESENVKKTYQILEQEIVINYDNVVTEPKVLEKFYLKINYNDIKDYLDFTMVADKEYIQENGYIYDKNKKTIAFTFDDGPNGAKTREIVDLLEQNKAHATFFMVGKKMELESDVIKNVLNKGNEIGSHSYNHTNMKRQKVADVVSGEMKTNEIYRNITGNDIVYTRPPYGSINDTIKNTLNTIFINWNIDTQDWLHRDKDYVVAMIMNNVKDGDIVLMHDSYQTTVDAVREVLPKLYAAGFQVVSVSELANLKGKVLEQHMLYRNLE